MSPATDDPLAVAALYAVARFRRNTLTQQNFREVIEAMMVRRVSFRA